MTDLPPATTEHTAPEHDPTTAADSDLRDAFGRVRTEVAQGRRRPGGRGVRHDRRTPRAGARAARGRPRCREDPARPQPRRRDDARHEAHPVHAGPDARRRHRVARLRRLDRHVPVPRGPRLHERPARRRGQPHAAEDPVGAARGDGGTPGQRRRRRPAAARPVLRRRDDEPDRVRGHLHAARGAARPVPDEADARHPAARRRVAGAPPPRRRVRAARRPVGRHHPRGRRRRGRVRRSVRSAPSAPATTCSRTSSTSPGPPGRHRPSGSVSAPAVRRHCSRPPRPGPG